jgi:hypothetical protein
MLKPLEPWKSKMIVLDGVDLVSSFNGTGEGHARGMGHLLTGTELAEGTLFGQEGQTYSDWAGGISVDQELAKRIGTATKLPSLELGVRVLEATVWHRISYLGRNQPVPPITNPNTTFKRIFGDTTLDAIALARLHAERRTVLDAIGDDYQRLSARLGVEDRHRVDAHLTAIREIETRLNSTATVSPGCQVPAEPASMSQNTIGNIPALGKLQMDLLAVAMACDITRVATLQWAQHGGQSMSFPWLGINDDHHTLGHDAVDTNPTAQAKLVKVNQWYSEQLAYLAGKLNSFAEGTSTVLDNSVILTGSELGNAYTHSRTDIPFLMIGSAGGYFRTGRYLKFPNGTRHNNLLVSMLNAMGVQTNTFGNPAYCTGPLPGLI